MCGTVPRDVARRALCKSSSHEPELPQTVTAMIPQPMVKGASSSDAAHARDGLRAVATWPTPYAQAVIDVTGQGGYKVACVLSGGCRELIVL